MQRTRFDDMNCSVAQCLEVVGEWWSLLILRDAFLGVRRFDDFQARLGISRSVLDQRLTRLVDQGILTRVPYRSIRPATSTASLTRGVTCGQSSPPCDSGVTRGPPPTALPSRSFTSPAATSPRSCPPARTAAKPSTPEPSEPCPGPAAEVPTWWRHNPLMRIKSALYLPGASQRPHEFEPENQLAADAVLPGEELVEHSLVHACGVQAHDLGVEQQGWK